MQSLRILFFCSLLTIALCTAVRAEEVKPEAKPEPTIEQLKVEVESLKSQLAQLRSTSMFEIRICNAAVQAAREFVQGPPAGSANQSIPLPRAPNPEPGRRQVPTP